MFQSPLWGMSCVIDFWSGCCCLQFLHRMFGNQFDALSGSRVSLASSGVYFALNSSYTTYACLYGCIYISPFGAMRARSRRLLCWNCRLGVYLSCVKRLEPIWCSFFPHSFGVWFLLISFSTYVLHVERHLQAPGVDMVIEFLSEYRIQVVPRLCTNLCSHATRLHFRIELLR